MKRCPRCRRYKQFQDFPRNRSNRDGLGTYCKPCHREVVKRNVELRHGGSENFLLKHRYGVSPGLVEALLKAQKGRCAVCKTEPADHVDHDHATGEVRGLLCFNCNGALGRFEDDVSVMRRAIAYLVAHGIER